MESSALSIALIYFLVANPIGNSPAILSLVKDYDFSRQKKIIFREAMISLLLALFFQFFGEIFLGALKISDYALTLTGGLVIFLVALQMIFHKPESASTDTVKQEPFIVPIATPLISGPGLMTMIMVTSREEHNDFKITLAILITWIGVTAVLVGAPYLQLLIGKRGIAALEQIMGMILVLISMNMIVSGVNIFLKTLS
ncbi:MAG TPA: MarC family protein [Parachlamydiaceae bacterium]|nr:MarC family protein [Parachlamydiaceae bacterium]